MLIVNEAKEIAGVLGGTLPERGHSVVYHSLRLDNFKDDRDIGHSTFASEFVMRVDKLVQNIVLDEMMIRRTSHLNDLSITAMTAHMVSPIWRSDESFSYEIYRDLDRNQQVFRCSVRVAVATTDQLETLFDSHDFQPL